MAGVKGLDLAIVQRVIEHIKEDHIREKLQGQLVRINHVRLDPWKREVWLRARRLWWDVRNPRLSIGTPTEVFPLGRVRFRVPMIAKPLSAQVTLIHGNLALLEYSTKANKIRRSSAWEILGVTVTSFAPVTKRQDTHQERSRGLIEFLGSRAIGSTSPAYDTESLAKVLSWKGKLPPDAGEVYSLADGFDVGDWAIRPLLDVVEIEFRGMSCPVLADGPDATFLVYYPRKPGKLVVVDHEETVLRPLGGTMREALKALSSDGLAA